MKNLIYALVNPIDGEVRYIGKTVSGMERPLGHLRPKQLAKDRTYKGKWIRALLRLGIRPVIRLLAVAVRKEDLGAMEVFWIAEGRRRGWRLTNLTNGGEGTPGHVQSAEHRAKIAAKSKGNKHSLGKPRSPETREKLRKANLGKKLSAEHKAKIGAAHVGKAISEAHKNALSRKLRGNKNAVGGLKFLGRFEPSRAPV